MVIGNSSLTFSKECAVRKAQAVYILKDLCMEINRIAKISYRSQFPKTIRKTATIIKKSWYV